jgi:SAM domain (Sterile alpha motif)/Adenylate and Guanylate cyclase catalytic domain
VRDVLAWLQGLGLGKYARAFEENEIDFDSLPYLTSNMLEQIGLPVGPRVKLLAAIAELPSRTTVEPETKRDEGADGRATVKGRQAERRQITVMFCDLVDSTRLAGSLDPEDFGSVMQAYQRACKAIIERYDGHVSQYRGDALEVYFGWPAAHEDAAERAVRAGLDVVEAVKAIAGPEPLSVRCRDQHRHGDGQRNGARGSVDAFGRRWRSASRRGPPSSPCGAQFGRHGRGH